MSVIKSSVPPLPSYKTLCWALRETLGEEMTSEPGLHQKLINQAISMYFSIKHTVLVGIWILKDLNRARERAFRVREDAVQTRS